MTIPTMLFLTLGAMAMALIATFLVWRVMHKKIKTLEGQIERRKELDSRTFSRGAIVDVRKKDSA